MFYLTRTAAIIIVCGFALQGCGAGSGAAVVTNAAPASLSATGGSFTEGNDGSRSIELSFSVANSPTTEFSVAYETLPAETGTAAATVGADYRASAGRILLAGSQTGGSVRIEVIGDVFDEQDEQFVVRFSAPDVVGSLSSDAIVTIEDDDPTPIASVSDVSVNENAGNAVFTVGLSAPSGLTASLDYATSEDSATAEDFGENQATLTFEPGETEQTIQVSITDDDIDEAAESFTVVLSNPVNVLLDDSEVTATILDDDDPVSGLDARPANASCVAPERPTREANVVALGVFPSLPRFSKPVLLLQRPGVDAEWYVVEQDGIVYRFSNTSGVSSRQLVVDLSARVDSTFNESGLLGMAFHPDFDSNGLVYLSFTETGSSDTHPLTSMLARFQSADDGGTIDPASEQTVLTVQQRYPNHNGGHVAFGPDGFLYAGFGDSGSAGDPEGRAQNTKNLHGSIIRIDVDNGQRYGIPPDNPFASSLTCISDQVDVDSVTDCPEIYAWGFRNPWRWSFDSSTGDLWLGDVGQDTLEEIDRVERGGNYGWNIQEGSACFNPPNACDTSEFVQPVVDYPRSDGNSVTGGVVYRGTQIPALVGRYVFGDFITGNIFALEFDEEGRSRSELLFASAIPISAFAEDQSGELYGLDYANGSIFQLAPSGGVNIDTVADKLSATGCVDVANPSQPSAGLIPFLPIAESWSDGATKERWYAIPDGTTVDVDAAGDWQFPTGSVIAQNLRRNTALVETRLLMRHTDGSWAGYSYEWDDTESDATRVIGGKVATIGGQPWVFPSEAQCVTCHTAAAGFTLGLEHAQLNSNILYPSTGIVGHQLLTADSIDVLSSDLGDLASIPTLVAPFDAAADLSDRARAYLHTNCSSCHRPGGLTNSDMDLRWDTPLAQTQTCGIAPRFGRLGDPESRILRPGDAARSLLVSRLDRRDVHGMPPIGTKSVDIDGVQLLSQWIGSLTGCP